jgi:hypothetical protein
MTEDQKGKLIKAFDVAHQNRLFEVDLFWKRALFFWGFIAVTFVGYVSVNKLHSNLSIIISVMGLFCSFAWALANRGSKYWQEYWERKVVDLETDVVGDLFIDDKPFAQRFKWLGGRKYSVSKIAISISDFLVFIWLCISLYEIFRYYSFLIITKKLFVTIFICVSALYMILVYLNCKSGKEINDKLPKPILMKLK